MNDLPYYCWNREHAHSTPWESESCTELYERWQEALAHLMTSVREDEVARQVNTVLPDDFDAWDEE